MEENQAPVMHNNSKMVWPDYVKNYCILEIIAVQLGYDTGK